MNAPRPKPENCTADQTDATATINNERCVTETCWICLSSESIERLARIEVVGIEQFAHEVCITNLPPRTLRLTSWCAKEPPTPQFREQIAATQTLGFDA
jgi:hypothetical protein